MRKNLTCLASTKVGLQEGHIAVFNRSRFAGRSIAFFYFISLSRYPTIQERTIHVPLVFFFFTCISNKNQKRENIKLEDGSPFNIKTKGKRPLAFDIPSSVKVECRLSYASVVLPYLRHPPAYSMQTSTVPLKCPSLTAITTTLPLPPPPDIFSTPILTYGCLLFGNREIPGSANPLS